MQTISNKDARRLILSSQRLTEDHFGKKKEGVQNVIEHLGYVQIDTISVVERAHHHTLWTRLPDYRKTYLDELIEKDKTVFEYWSHAAAYLPMRDYRFSLIRKNMFLSRKIKWFTNKKMTAFVFDRIKAEGPLQSKDFEEKRAKAGWWEWKETKRALEQLFMEGRLMIAKREGFQKVYDLTERVIPKDIDTTTPGEDDYARYLIIKSIRANGLAAASEIGYLRNFTKKHVAKVIAQMVEEEHLVEIKVKGVEKDIFYTTEQNLEGINEVKLKNEIKILSPFDNTVIQRSRLKKIFDFDYTIECYVPEPKRKYGYFCLPLLYKDEFVGRMDCKADRSEGVLIVRNVFWEKKKDRDEQLKKALAKFAKFNGCGEVSWKPWQ